MTSALFAHGVSAEPQRCVYTTWEWNTQTRQSENHRRVDKPYDALTSAERDPASSCTVCEADQVTIKIAGIDPFRMCSAVADGVRKALTAVVASGFEIRSISAYRVGRTRGPVDKAGRRTGFSNHSFGTAIDLNAAHNGLYGNCVTFGTACTLRRGGEWRPSNPLSVTRGSVAYRALIEAGFKWGGEIKGRQKDFMHFSLSGY